MTAEASGATVRTVLDTHRGLIRRAVEVPEGSRFEGTAGPGGELWFVIAGQGRLACGALPPMQVRQDTGVWLPPGERYRLSADGPGALRLDSVCLPAGPAGQDGDTDVPRLSELGDRPVEVTGDRRFRVLFGPECSTPSPSRISTTSS